MVLLFGPLLEEKLTSHSRQQARQPHATAGFQLPGAPGMQREPRRAAVEACVREQRALSVPKKQPGGDFHLVCPNATAGSKPYLIVQRWGFADNHKKRALLGQLTITALSP